MWCNLLTFNRVWYTSTIILYASIPFLMISVVFINRTYWECEADTQACVFATQRSAQQGELVLHQRRILSLCWRSSVHVFSCCCVWSHRHAVVLSLTVALSDSAGPDRMPAHVPPDEVNSHLQWGTKTMHLHAYDGQLVSKVVVCISV